MSEETINLLEWIPMELGFAIGLFAIFRMTIRLSS